MVYLQPPANFQPKMSVAVCFIEYNNEVLFLHRSEYVVQPNTWGIPGGKVEPNETPLDAVKREIIEECGFALSNPKHAKTVYIRYPDYDYDYHMYIASVEHKPKVILEKKESQAYAWLTRQQVNRLDLENKLVTDEMPCIECIYQQHDFGKAVFEVSI